MADLSARVADSADSEVDFEQLANDPQLAWQLAQVARSNGKWALASKLVRIAREGGECSEV